MCVLGLKCLVEISSLCMTWKWLILYYTTVFLILQHSDVSGGLFLREWHGNRPFEDASLPEFLEAFQVKSDPCLEMWLRGLVWKWHSVVHDDLIFFPHHIGNADKICVLARWSDSTDVQIAGFCDSLGINLPKLLHEHGLLVVIIVMLILEVQRQLYWKSTWQLSFDNDLSQYVKILDYFF